MHFWSKQNLIFLNNEKTVHAGLIFFIFQFGSSANKLTLLAKLIFALFPSKGIHGIISLVCFFPFYAQRNGPIWCTLVQSEFIYFKDEKTVHWVDYLFFPFPNKIELVDLSSKLLNLQKG